MDRMSQDAFLDQLGWRVPSRKYGRRITRCAALAFRPNVDAKSFAMQTKRIYQNQYGSIVLMLLVSVLADLIVKAILKWWADHHPQAEASITAWKSEPFPD